MASGIRETRFFLISDTFVGIIAICGLHHGLFGVPFFPVLTLGQPINAGH